MFRFIFERRQLSSVSVLILKMSTFQCFGFDLKGEVHVSAFRLSLASEEEESVVRNCRRKFFFRLRFFEIILLKFRHARRNEWTTQSARCHSDRERYELSPYTWSMWCLKRQDEACCGFEFFVIRSSSSSLDEVGSSHGFPYYKLSQPIFVRLGSCAVVSLQKRVFERRVFCPCVRRNRLLDAHVSKPRGVDAAGVAVSV